MDGVPYFASGTSPSPSTASGMIGFFSGMPHTANVVAYMGWACTTAFTGGYSPHMIMSFAQPLGIGLTSDAEYMDIELAGEISSSEALQALNQVMAEGIEVLSFRQIAEDKKSSGMTIVAAADYLVTVKESDSKGQGFPDFWKNELKTFLDSPEILIMKKTKRSEKETDIRPLIYQMELREQGMYLKLAAGSEANLKPDLVMDARTGRRSGRPCPAA